MKKILASLCVASLAMGAMAADTVYRIWPVENTPATETLIPTDFYAWGGYNGEVLSADGQQYCHWTPWGDLNWYGGGYITSADFDLTPIVTDNYDIVMEVRASEAFKFKIKVENQRDGASVSALELPFAFDMNGEWQTVRINLKKNFPNQIASYQKGDRMYIVCPVGNSIDGGAIPKTSTFDYRNVRLEPYQAPAAVAAGTTYYGSVTNTEHPVVIDYKCVVNADQTFTIFANFTGTESFTDFNYQVNVADNWLTFEPAEGEYTHKVTTPNSYVNGDILNCFFWNPYAGGVLRTDFSYTFGASNAPAIAAPYITATAEKITYNSAEIAWNVTLPAALTGADVKVLLNDEVIAANPYLLSGLAENTEYNYTLKAIATLDGKEYASNDIKVNFRTLREFAKDAIYTGSQDLTLQNAKVTLDTSEDVPATVNYTITYTAEGQLIFDVELITEKDVIGLVPQLFLNNAYNCNLQQVTRSTTYWTATPAGNFTEGQNIPVSFLVAYNGGGIPTETINYEVGSTNTVAVNAIGAESLVKDVYTLSGVRVLRNADKEAISNLTPGMYIVGGKKVVVK